MYIKFSFIGICRIRIKYGGRVETFIKVLDPGQRIYTLPLMTHTTPLCLFYPIYRALYTRGSCDFSLYAWPSSLCTLVLIKYTSCIGIFYYRTSLPFINLILELCSLVSQIPFNKILYNTFSFLFILSLFVCYTLKINWK